jgi:hypothetical protein
MGTEPITEGLNEPGGGGGGGGACEPVAEGVKGWAGLGAIPEAALGAGGPGLREPVLAPV